MNARSLIEASLDPLITINTEGKITDMNAALTRITGMTREQLTGTDFFDYFTEPQMAREVYQEVFAKGSVADSPLTLRHKDGKLTDVLFNGSVYKDDDGGEGGVVIVARNVTAQKLLSKYSLSLIEASLDPLVTINPEGKITDMNEAMANITGLTREQLRGSDFFDYFTEPQKAREVYQEVFANGSVADLPLTLRHKNGVLTDVLFNGSVYRDDRGNVLGVVIVARDVTAQKLLSKYSLSLIEASLDPLVTINPEGKITDMNEALVKITGISREELRGTDFLDYFTEPQMARKVYQEVFAKGSVTDSPLTLRHLDGKLTDVLFNGSVYKDDRGNVLGVVIVARDVTAQKLLSKYSLSLIEASLDPLVTISPEGKITDMNEALVNITGMTRKQLRGTDFFDYFTEQQKAREVYQEVFAKGSVADSPLTLCHKNGKLTDVLFNGSVYRDDRGNVLGVVIVARDVTDRKRASKYARSIIEAGLDPLFAINVVGKIIDVNESTLKATEMTRKEILGTNFFNYFTEPDKARHAYKQIFDQGFITNVPLVIRDGKDTTVMCNGSVYKDDRGKVLGVVIVARDITLQKRIATELNEAKVFAELATGIAEQAKLKAESATMIAENAVKAKQQFLSNMSHEIRTPMNAIIGFTKVVLKTDLNAKQKEYLTAIKMSGDALIVLINDILDLAKVDAGKMTFEQTPFKMSLSISAMLHLFETKIQEKNLELIREYDQNIPEVLVGDSVRLHQIILNLVSNAVKFTSEGSITVSVNLVREDEITATVEFAVADTGIGIAEEKIKTIFENFQQASSGTSRLYGGTGLGLAIVKQLVEPQGGTIHVESKINQGSRFSFTLSFLKTKAETEAEVEMMKIDTDIKNVKVLVVEDIPLNQLLMKTILDEFGFERDIADNGRIAIEKLREKQYDIVLMDLQMPEMNGFEATEYIRKTLHSSIPIVALTADVTTVDLAKCRAVGMNDYIAKPIDERVLYSKMIGLIKKPITLTSGKDGAAYKDAKPKCIDLDYLVRRTKSNPELMMQMISLYLEQTPPLISAMKQGWKDKDWTSLYAAVHKMIPSFSIMGISVDFENMAKKVQEYASTQLQSEGISELVLQIEMVCTQACLELEEEFNTIKNTTIDSK
jgi:PAS domain S-box-containing protein